MNILEINDNDCSGDILHTTPDSSSTTSSLCFVLVETSRPGNIGAAARAIKTMGYSRLILVRPRFPDPATQPEAIAFASGAQDVLEAAEVVDSIEAALGNCHFVGAVSARLREFSPPVITPREWAAKLKSSGASCAQNTTFQLALVFGNERFGLPNEIVEQCDVLINIPANPAYSSLNLAQAVQILSYECAMADQFSDALNDQLRERPSDQLGERPESQLEVQLNKRSVGSVGFTGIKANKSQISAMFGHLEEALLAINFIDADNPKRLMSRLHRLFARSGLETEEVNILRGIATHILKTLR